jgi:hypothetical protein
LPATSGSPLLRPRAKLHVPLPLALRSEAIANTNTKIHDSRCLSPTTQTIQSLASKWNSPKRAAHSRTAKALQSITYLHDNQAVTISSRIGIIRAQIQRHPEDIDIIQKEAKEAEDERQRKKAEAVSKGVRM